MKKSKSPRLPREVMGQSGFWCSALRRATAFPPELLLRLVLMRRLLASFLSAHRPMASRPVLGGITPWHLKKPLTRRVFTPKASMVTHFPTKSKRRQSHRSKKTSVKLIWSCIVLLLRVAPIQRPAKFTSQCSSQSVTKLLPTARWIPIVTRSKTSLLSPRLKKRFNTPLM